MRKWAQFTNNYQKSSLRRWANDKEVCFAVLVFYVLPRHTNIMIDKGFNLYYEYTS